MDTITRGWWLGLALLLGAGCDAPHPRASAQRIRGRSPPPVDAPAPVAAAARLLVTPASQDWGPIAVGATWFHVFSFVNFGDRVMRFERLVIVGDAAFTLTIDGADPAARPGLLDDPDQDGRAGLDPGGRFDARVLFRPERGGPHEAQLVAVTDDPDAPRVEVPLTATGAEPPPCVGVEPARVTFGHVPVGLVARQSVVVRNCTPGPLHVTGVRYEAGAFAVPPGVERQLPLRLPAPRDWSDQPGAALEITFLPQFPGSHFGTLDVLTDDRAEPVRTVELYAEGVPNRCPAAAVAADRLVVSLGEAALLDGSPSTDPEGARLQYVWTLLDRPADARADVQERPGADGRPRPDQEATATAALVPDRVGRYRVELDVIDPLGNRSSDCDATAVVDVTARPPAEGFTVELDWENPADPLPDDLVGADLDLHLAHPLAAGRWFDPETDCSPGSPRPDWGRPLDPADDPVLSVAGLDGGGPEIIRLAAPQPTGRGEPYRVGVHYFRRLQPASGEDFGPAFARVRIYAGGDLVWDSVPRGGDRRRLADVNHFWEVAEIAVRPGGVDVRAIDRYFEGRP